MLLAQLSDRETCARAGPTVSHGSGVTGRIRTKPVESVLEWQSAGAKAVEFASNVHSQNSATGIVEVTGRWCTWAEHALYAATSAQVLECLPGC